MNKMRLYLDVCTFCRPFDNQNMMRIRLETDSYYLMNETVLIEKAVQVLVREMGAVEAGRFLTLPQHKREESLKRHQDWQNGLEQEQFFDDVFND